MGQVSEATETALSAAKHLTDMDVGAIQALRVLATKVDEMTGGRDDDGDYQEPKFDNVTLPTYLKYCESLGLTPAGRDRLNVKKDEGGKPRGQLISLQGGIPRPA